MDKCQFSEFTYGYCVTEDLVVGKGTTITGAPIFPSLIEEGQQGAGYDLKLERPGIPLFIQFKLVHQMVRDTAMEAKKGQFKAPFYRMHLRRRSLSDQHESLLSLEQSGFEVYYAAPAFHTIEDLNKNYLANCMWDRSFKIRPSKIGKILDDKNHHVSFTTANGPSRRYSEEPSELLHPSSAVQIEKTIRSQIDAGKKRNFRDQLPEIDAKLEQIVADRNKHRTIDERVELAELKKTADPIRRTAYLARQFFDCQLMYMTTREPNTQV